MKKYSLALVLALLLVFTVSCSNGNQGNNNVAVNNAENNETIQTDTDKISKDDSIEFPQDEADVLANAEKTEDGAIIIDNELLYKLTGARSTLLEDHWRVLASLTGKDFVDDYTMNVFNFDEDVHGSLLIDVYNDGKVPIHYWSNDSKPSNVPVDERVFEIINIEDLPDRNLIVNVSQEDGEPYNFNAKIYISEVIVDKEEVEVESVDELSPPQPKSLSEIVDDADRNEDGAIIVSRDLLYTFTGPESSILEHHWHNLTEFSGKDYTEDFSKPMFIFEDDVKGNLLIDFRNKGNVPVKFWSNDSNPANVPAGEKVFEIINIEDLPDGLLEVNISQEDGKAYDFSGMIYIEEK